MTSTGHKRAWRAPTAITLAVRNTAGLIGPGGDNFLKTSPYGGLAERPTAPSADTGDHPVPPQSATGNAAGADERAWDAPLVTALRL
jgi:hypothetical protein